MTKFSEEFKAKMVKERLPGKTFTVISRENSIIDKYFKKYNNEIIKKIIREGFYMELSTIINIIIAAISCAGLCYFGWSQKNLLRRQNNLIVFEKRYKVYEIFRGLIKQLDDFDFIDKTKTDEDIIKESSVIVLKMQTETSSERILFDKETRNLLDADIKKITKKITDILSIRIKYNDSSVDNRYSTYAELLAEREKLIKILEEICEILEKKLYIGDL